MSEAWIALPAAEMLELGSEPATTAASALPSGSQTAAISGMLGMIWPDLRPASATFTTSGSLALICSSAALRAGTFGLALNSARFTSGVDQ